MPLNIWKSFALKQRKKYYNPATMFLCNAHLAILLLILIKLKVSNKTKINSDYYVTYIMKPLVENYLTSMYSNDINKVLFITMLQPHIPRSLTQKNLRNLKIFTEFNSSVKRNTRKSLWCKSMRLFCFWIFKTKIKTKESKNIEWSFEGPNQVWQQISIDMIRRVYVNWIKRLKLIN